MTPAVLAWRRVTLWGGVAALGGGALSLSLFALLGTSRFQVIGRQSVFAVLWPLYPWIGSVGATRCVPLRPSWIVISSRGLPAIATRHALCVALSVASPALVCEAGQVETSVRNGALFVGLASLTTALRGSYAGAWVAGFLLATMMWLLGTTTTGHERWAFLLDTSPNGRLTLTLVGFGAAAYVGMWLSASGSWNVRKRAA